MHVVTNKRIGEELYNEVKKYSEERGFYFHYMNSYNSAEIKRQLKKELEERDSILIVGSDVQLPTAEFIHRDQRRPTDVIYEIDEDGNFIYKVGRVYGNFNTIRKHLDMEYINNNKAVVIDIDPKEEDLSYKAVKELGFDVTPIKKLNWRTRKAFKKASFILQYSDGPYSKRVHGTPSLWGSPLGKVLDSDDVKKIGRFEAYPFVFSEACETCLFGPLLTSFLEKGSVIVGSTSDTVNNIKEEPAYLSHSSDGFKYLTLDYLHEEKTIGDVILRVKQTLYNTLSDNDKEDLLRISYKGFTFSNEKMLPILQFNTFGNPDRPTPVVNGKFDLKEEIPVDI